MKRNAIEMLLRCKESGKGALIIKAGDILDNSRRWELSPGDRLSNRLLIKVKRCLELSRDELGSEPVWNELNREYQRLRGDMGLV